MKTKLALTTFAAALALTASLPLVQAAVPFAGTSAAFARQGADDGPNHDANDDKGGKRGGKSRDDAATHDKNDDKGGKRGGKSSDDSANHNKNDHKGGTRGGHK
ncbi:hypothetical protein [Rhizobium sp. NFR12]|uniref:hypothetical protein n=1 Tax=Rhizobium sp. NFR12 TaxID=1566261 RepID=UPI0008A7EB78|nr:hypothetical protein [Rhizobium sp. NFR12]SEH22127.1 hypothetical protein SAMN03159407_0911 [Rhizobium sp. NFR12]